MYNLVIKDIFTIDSLMQTLEKQDNLINKNMLEKEEELIQEDILEKEDNLINKNVLEKENNLLNLEFSIKKDFISEKIFVKS